MVEDCANIKFISFVTKREWIEEINNANNDIGNNNTLKNHDFIKKSVSIFVEINII